MSFQIIVNAKLSRPLGPGHGLLCVIPDGEIYWTGLHPKPFVIEQDGSTVVVAGAPIVQGQIDPASAARMFISAQPKRSAVASLNGQFLIACYQRETRMLYVVTDRFCSHAFYYWKQGPAFIGSNTYSDIWCELKARGQCTPRIESFYEFLHLQRLLGDETYDTQTKSLGAGTVLSIVVGAGEQREEKYFDANYCARTQLPLERHAADLANLIRKSVQQMTSDGKRYGLLLSGGLDSRVVLAASEPANAQLSCYTVGERPNTEVHVSRQVAERKGVPHYFIRRSAIHYSQAFDQAVYLGSGMNVFDHAHFLNLGSELTANVDVLLHGHAFDYFFQGMYLPTRAVNFGRWMTHLKRLRPLTENLGELYLSQIKYRLKGVDPLSLVKKERRNLVSSAIRESVGRVLAHAQSVSHDAYDLWEYFHTQALSRHYTHLNLLSMRAISEERTVCFDNEIYDFFLSTPIRHRLDGRILRQTLQFLASDLAALPNSNTSYPAHLGSGATTGLLYWNKLLKRVGSNKFSLPPAPDERSWPNRDELIRREEALRVRTEALSQSYLLASLDLFEMDQIRLYVQRHLRGEGNYGSLLLTLLTIEGFLQLDKPVSISEQSTVCASNAV